MAIPRAILALANSVATQGRPMRSDAEFRFQELTGIGKKRRLLSRIDMGLDSPDRTPKISRTVSWTYIPIIKCLHRFRSSRRSELGSITTPSMRRFTFTTEQIAIDVGKSTAPARLSPGEAITAFSVLAPLTPTGMPVRHRCVT